MKTLKNVTLSTIILVLLLQKLSFGQVTVPWNTPGVLADYVGWTIAEPFALNIRHDGVWPIDFYTGGFAPVNHRMTILGTNAGLLAGHVGIGNLGFAPLN